MDAAQAAGADVDSSPNPTIDLSKIENNSSCLSDIQDGVEPYDLHMVDFTAAAAAASILHTLQMVSLAPPTLKVIVIRPFPVTGVTEDWSLCTKHLCVP